MVQIIQWHVLVLLIKSIINLTILVLHVLLIQDKIILTNSYVIVQLDLYLMVQVILYHAHVHQPKNIKYLTIHAKLAHHILFKILTNNNVSVLLDLILMDQEFLYLAHVLPLINTIHKIILVKFVLLIRFKTY